MQSVIKLMKIKTNRLDWSVKRTKSKRASPAKLLLVGSLSMRFDRKQVKLLIAIKPAINQILESWAV